MDNESFLYAHPIPYKENEILAISSWIKNIQRCYGNASQAADALNKEDPLPSLNHTYHSLQNASQAADESNKEDPLHSLNHSLQNASRAADELKKITSNHSLRNASHAADALNKGDSFVLEMQATHLMHQRRASRTLIFKERAMCQYLTTSSALGPMKCYALFVRKDPVKIFPKQPYIMYPRRDWRKFTCLIHQNTVDAHTTCYSVFCVCLHIIIRTGCTSDIRNVSDVCVTHAGCIVKGKSHI